MYMLLNNHTDLIYIFHAHPYIIHIKTDKLHPLSQVGRGGGGGESLYAILVYLHNKLMNSQLQWKYFLHYEWAFHPQ